MQMVIKFLCNMHCPYIVIQQTRTLTPPSTKSAIPIVIKILPVVITSTIFLTVSSSQNRSRLTFYVGCNKGLTYMSSNIALKQHQRNLNDLLLELTFIRCLCRIIPVVIKCVYRCHIALRYNSLKKYYGNLYDC